ncbi:MAG: NYN domain-containing protein [Rhodospirillales bacterium]|nr:NYN domain-containing protein [Rhodospirillales bacterium]
MAPLTRIGIFYDGSFFARVSEHYRYRHERGAWISIAGLHEFVRHEVAKGERTEGEDCKIVEAHYFRGRFPAEEAAERKDALLRERRFEDVLIRAGVTPHFLLMRSGEVKGIDIWLALEAYELALRQRLDVVVLVTGDSDFLQLVRKLSANGTRTMVTAWDLEPSESVSGTRTAQVLLDAATYPIMMDAIINDRARRLDSLISNLFVHPAPSSAPPSDDGGIPEHLEKGPDEFDNGSVRDHSALASVVQSADAGRATSDFSESGEPSTGVIASLPLGRDFGFIEPAGGGSNLFFHASWVEGCFFDGLQVGDPVCFVVSVNPKDGRPTAMQVSRTR